MKGAQHILLTGGAGYIGSALAGFLLRRGAFVTAMDKLLFGGDALLAYLPDPGFHFELGDVCDPNALAGAARAAMQAGAPPPTAVVHLAAIVGYPACKLVSKELVWRTNVEAVQHALAAAEALAVERFIFSSTYSVYGIAKDGKPLVEDAELSPQSLYAESKIAAEVLLKEASVHSACAPLIFRFATLYGLSPRMRFDLIIHQFVLDAFTHGELILFERENTRSFVHIQDVLQGILLALDADPEIIRGRVLNLGDERGNYTKREIAEQIQAALPDLQVKDRDVSFNGDMRDIRLSFRRVRDLLDFSPQRSVKDGIREVLEALKSGLLGDPHAERYRNAPVMMK